MVDPSVPGGRCRSPSDRSYGHRDRREPDQQPVLGKLVSLSNRIEYLDVNARDGVWITGAPDQPAILDPHGQYRVETLRRAGTVSLWEQGGVTFRIEGATSKDDALAVAAPSCA